MLVDLGRLEREYFAAQPDLDDPTQLVSFGTSGHRGSPLRGSFTEAHILAITQAICDYRQRQGIDGPLYMGKDTHALSSPAQRTALEVLAANGVETIIQRDDGVTPTPVISRAILVHNRGRSDRLADGIVITPSHNPPEDGGFKYNPPNGGPADTDVTHWIQDRANELLRGGNAGVRRVPFAAALNAATTHAAGSRPALRRRPASTSSTWTRSARAGSRSASIRSAARRWPIGSRSTASTSLDIAVVNPAIDPTFSFMTVDHDGKIRMDCSSPYAMARLVGLKDHYRRRLRQRPGRRPARHRHAVGRADEPQPLSGGGDSISADAPPAVAAAAADRQDAGQQQHDRPGRRTSSAGSCTRCRSASSGSRPACSTALLLRRRGERRARASCAATARVWTTDKDGPIMDLLAAEITARTGKDPGEHYQSWTQEFGAAHYTRIDAPATPEQKASFGTAVARGGHGSRPGRRADHRAS